jgi:hypothetical protein
MNQNNNNHDFGYIEIFQREYDLYKEFDLRQKSMNRFNNYNNNKDYDLSDEEMDETIGQYYGSDVINGKKWFICKYNDCEQTEVIQKLMKQHIKQHLSQENIYQIEINLNPIVIKSEVIDSSDEVIDEIESDFNANRSERRIRSNEIKSENRYFCDWFECNKSFRNNKTFERHINKHKNEEVLKEDQNNVQKVSSSETSFREIGEYVEVLKMNGKEVYHCEWSDCQFSSKSFEEISRHIRYEHLNIRQTNFDKTIRRQQFLTHRREGHQKRSQNTLKVKVKEEPNEQIVVNGIKVISNQNNTLLSCKGLTSSSKVKQYFDRIITNGEKKFFCKWIRCEFTTNKTQKIAEHINTKHLGLTFKCPQPNCSKVYKSTHSWREHQKNHLCGFGWFGDGRKVKGVCNSENINTYREKILVDGKRVHRCKWPDCGVSFANRSGIKRHIHNQHICPFRLIANLNINQVPNEVQNSDSSQPKEIKFKQLFKCKRRGCKAKFTVHSDLLKHENLFCFFRTVTTSNNLRTQGSNEFIKSESKPESQIKY